MTKNHSVARGVCGICVFFLLPTESFSFKLKPVLLNKSLPRNELCIFSFEQKYFPYVKNINVAFKREQKLGEGLREEKTRMTGWCDMPQSCSNSRTQCQRLLESKRGMQRGCPVSGTPGGAVGFTAKVFVYCCWSHRKKRH